jgi:4-hydroxybenzoate polyprenyltransferase
MAETLRHLAVVSRAEFLLPNLGSLIMGLAWGANPTTPLIELARLVVLSFTIINLSSAIGAQVNTMSDRALDARDNRKTQLVQALNRLGYQRLMTVMLVELAVTGILVAAFMWTTANPVLLVMWIAGISLGTLYSAPPVRIKARSWLAPVTLILVLAIFPVLFAYFTFTSELHLFFLLALAGLAATVYGVIIPTEIRDYFGDKAMGIETMTVRLGLRKASLLSMILLSVGGVLIGIAFFAEFAQGRYPVLSLLVAAMATIDGIVLRKFQKLYTLSQKYERFPSHKPLAQEIMRFSANNPKWIMLVTQTYSLLSILLFASKCFALKF